MIFLEVLLPYSLGTGRQLFYAVQPDAVVPNVRAVRRGNAADLGQGRLGNTLSTSPSQHAPCHG